MKWLWFLALKLLFRIRILMQIIITKLWAIQNDWYLCFLRIGSSTGDFNISLGCYMSWEWWTWFTFCDCFLVIRFWSILRISFGITVMKETVKTFEIGLLCCCFLFQWELQGESNVWTGVANCLCIHVWTGVANCLCIHVWTGVVNCLCIHVWTGVANCLFTHVWTGVVNCLCTHVWTGVAKGLFTHVWTGVANCLCTHVWTGVANCLCTH